MSQVVTACGRFWFTLSVSPSVSIGDAAVLSHELALRSVSSAGGAVGSTIRLDDAPCTVVGVMPEGLGFRDERVRIWTGLSIDAEETPINRASHPLLAIGRFRGGVTPEQAAAQLATLRSHWSATYPDHYAKGHFAVTRPLQEDLVGDQRQAVWLLSGAVLFVMLIVCVNLAALLVRAGKRADASRGAACPRREPPPAGARAAR